MASKKIFILELKGNSLKLRPVKKIKSKPKKRSNVPSTLKPFKKVLDSGFGHNQNEKRKAKRKARKRN